MHYEEALRVWGASKLIDAGYELVDVAKVRVDIEIDPGYACCGGNDPNCYCSFAEPPSSKIMIYSNGMSTSLDLSYSIDFTTLLNEIIAAGEGSITNEETK